jgi:pyruvate/2-oxoglutarate dehydrogenase complex dihydrolipoamide acyltransferase (E2) component
MEDFLIPDRARIAARLRSLARVDRATRANGALPPSPSPSPMGRGDSPRPLGEAAAQRRVRAASWAETLIAAQQIPQASSVVEMDLSAAARRLDAEHDTWRERNLEPSFTPILAEALVAALREVPQANAAFDTDGRGIRRYPVVHLGISVASADGGGARYGLIRDADTRNALGLALEIETIRQRGGESPDTLSEATVTLADYGPGSALFAVPMVLPGQAVAVRAGAVEERLFSRERGFVVAPTVYVCASIDHRVLDGSDAGALLGAMKRHLEDSG